MSSAGGANDEAVARKPRAKHACRECNLRRVKCNVMDGSPCTNCQNSGAKCEVLPSRRGRYPRKKRRQQLESFSGQPVPYRGSNPGTEVDDTETGDICQQAPSIRSNSPQPHQDISSGDISAQTPSPSADSVAPGTLFFGESNFLTLVPGRTQETEGSPHTNDPNANKQKARLLFPIASTPQSLPEGQSPASIEHLSAGTTRYLRDEGALTLPDLQTCIPALQAYFKWFHPCFPILDRADFTQKVASMNVSYILLQAMLFIGATYCDDGTIISMGFKDRSEAKSLLYTRARLLFHADWEKDETTLIQSLFLMSFWRGGPSDVRDVRYWLGVVIGVAESYGLHRSARFTTKDPKLARLRKRIWWSIYVRERQAAASLGLPSRIRDNDCDIEPLSTADLESEVEDDTSPQFGTCKPEHVTYAIKMAEIAKILGHVVDVHFAPGRLPSTPEKVRSLDAYLEAWRKSLPEELKDGVDDGNASVWCHLLHLSYNHIRILIHRHDFLKHGKDDKNGQLAVAAASKISRIAEDMLAQGTLRYGQMHLITSLFAALCIHTITIRRTADLPRRIAEHRAQMCLLGLQEIQKYWRINNNVLDLFLRYLDTSIANRLQPQEPQGEGERYGGGERLDLETPLEDQYFNMLYGPWEGDGGMADLGMVLQVDEPLQMSGLDILERAL